jgi:hypothetical protein
MTVMTIRFQNKSLHYFKAISNNNDKPGYTQHVLNTVYTYENIGGAMDIFEENKRGRYLNVR